MSTPLVSIITPNFNCSRYIAETIESVLAQTYTNWEMIIVDDCSTDDSYQIATEYSKKDSRIKVLKNEKNSGAAFSRNSALDIANGEYIAFLDSDDLWLPEKLEKQIKFMQENNYFFTYTNFEHISEDSKSLNVFVSGPKIVTRRMLNNSNYLGCLTVMYDKKIVGDISISDKIKKRNDHALWLKVIDITKKCYLLDENLSKYRKRENSISNVSITKLLKHHYILYKETKDCSTFVAIYYTCLNLVYGFIRKKKYTKMGGNSCK